MGALGERGATMSGPHEVDSVLHRGCCALRGDEVIQRDGHAGEYGATTSGQRVIGGVLQRGACCL